MLKSLVQIQKETSIAKFAKGIIKGKVGACCFIKQYTQTSTVARLKHLEKFGAMFVICGLQICEINAADKFVRYNRVAKFG